MPTGYRWMEEPFTYEATVRLNTAPSLFAQWLYVYRQEHLVGKVGRYIDGSDLFLSDFETRSMPLVAPDIPAGEGILPAPLVLYINAYIPVCDVEPRPEGQVTWGLSTHPDKPGLRHYIICSDGYSPPELRPSPTDGFSFAEVTPSPDDSHCLTELRPFPVEFEVIRFTVLQLALERIEVKIEYWSGERIPGVPIYAQRMMKAIREYWPEANQQTAAETAQDKNSPGQGTNSGERGNAPKGPTTLAKQEEYRRVFPRAMQLQEQGKNRKQIAALLKRSPRWVTDMMKWGAWDVRERYREERR